MIGGIIFARTSSTRLPSKIVKKIQNRTILEHIIKRIKKSNLEKIILATTENEIDDELVEIAKSNNIEYFRGSENDVLDRCYRTAKMFSIDPIVRITGDDPIKDPSIIDQAIKIYNNSAPKFDLVCNTLNPTFPEGLDVELFSFNTLETIWQNAKNQDDREHVTKYIYEHSNEFNIFNFENPKNLSNIRLTLDTEEDFELIKSIYDALFPSKPIFSWNDVVSFLQSNPHLLEINKDIKKSGRYQSENN